MTASMYGNERIEAAENRVHTKRSAGFSLALRRSRMVHFVEDCLQMSARF